MANCVNAFFITKWVIIFELNLEIQVFHFENNSSFKNKLPPATKSHEEVHKRCYSNSQIKIDMH